VSSEVPIRKVNSGRKRWLLDCRSIGGHREFFLTRDEAESVREVRLNEVRQFGSAALEWTQAERIAAVSACARLAKLGATLAQAVEFYERHHRPVAHLQFSDGITQFLEAKRSAHLNSEHVRQLGSHLGALLRTLGNRPLALVSQLEIESWLHSSGWHPYTIRNLRISTRTFFRFALKRGWIATDPAEHIEPVKLPDATPGILTIPEASALLKAAHKRRQTLPHVVLNLLCGIRPEECAKLGPEQINLARGFVEVPAAVAKSRKRRIVELSENAKAWLKVAPPLTVHKSRWYRDQLAGLRAEASKILGRPMPWPKNCLRHSFASYHLAMHGSADKTATQMGHRSTDMLFRHYRELVAPEDAKAFWSIMPA
jgi:integrase